MPKILTPATETSTVTITEGDSLQLSCQAWGWPVPTLLWQRKDTVLGIPQAEVNIKNYLSQPTGLFQTTLYVSNLTISNMNQSDQMNYTCTAYNQFGTPILTYQQNVTVYVRVKGMFFYCILTVYITCSMLPVYVYL